MDELNDKGTAAAVDIHKYHNSDRTEEVQDIINRMPMKFGYWISLIVLAIFAQLVLFGYLIRYPDVVKGQVTVNTPVAPIKLVANSAGKLKLNHVQSQTPVSSGQVIAYIENATSYEDLQHIKSILESYDPTDFNNTEILFKLPSKVALGELSSRYYNFYSSLQLMYNFNKDSLFDKQIKSLRNLYIHQRKEMENSYGRIYTNRNVEEYTYKFFKRDSLLYASQVTAEADLDKSKLNYLNAQVGYSNARSSQIEAEKQAQQTLSKIAEVDLQKNEKRKELEVALLVAYNNLADNITAWDQRYLFKAPFNGTVQFLRFWTDQQFVQSNEPVFTVIPQASEPYGQAVLPAAGSGKVKIGQEVIAKLDDFPYNEFGSIKGVVSRISLTASTEKTSQGNLETYLVTVTFPAGLTTNYGKQLSFRHESKGTVEVITNDRRLIERLFDNLKYVLNR